MLYFLDMHNNHQNQLITKADYGYEYCGYYNHLVCMLENNINISLYNNHNTQAKMISIFPPYTSPGYHSRRELGSVLNPDVVPVSDVKVAKIK